MRSSDVAAMRIGFQKIMKAEFAKFRFCGDAGRVSKIPDTKCHEVPKIRCCDDAEARAMSTQRYLSREGHQSWTNSRLGRAPTPPTDEYPYDDYEGFDDDGLFKYDDDPRDD